MLESATAVLRLVLLLVEIWRERSQQNVGYAKSIKDVADWAHRRVAEADAERVAAENTHKSDPTDAAFDPAFRRD